MIRETQFWPTYRSHKIISALPIVEIVALSNKARRFYVEVQYSHGQSRRHVFKPTVSDVGQRAQVGDYVVIYSSGYESISPKAVFEEEYTQIGAFTHKDS